MTRSIAIALEAFLLGAATFNAAHHPSYVTVGGAIGILAMLIFVFRSRSNQVMEDDKSV